jgi:hypothetical protein
MLSLGHGNISCRKHYNNPDCAHDTFKTATARFPVPAGDHIEETIILARNISFSLSSV